MQTPDKTVPWNQVAAIRSNTTRKAVFEAITEQPQCASEIADELDHSRPTISKHIHWLRDEDMVECLTPDRPHHRLYGLTGAGKQAAENI